MKIKQDTFKTFPTGVNL